MRPYVLLEKPIGETPLQALTKWKQENPEYQDVPAAYAGRLDPMASGKLLIVLGEECKRIKEYTGLDKEYEIEVLLDIGSDTGDALGLVSYSGYEIRSNAKMIAAALSQEIGAHLRTYPAFSSKPVNGKPLFLHALTGTLGSIELPKHIERIHSIQDQGAYRLSFEELARGMRYYLSLVPKSDESSKEEGQDFRIKDVIKSWDELFGLIPERDFIVLRLRVVCGTGTYMRSLAERIGASLGTKALALSIRRTKIGRSVKGVWIKKY